MKSSILCSVLLVFFAVSTSHGQAKNSTGRLELIYADSLIGRQENSMSIRILSGHVLFQQDSATMRCDRAVQYVDQVYSVFSGNVVIHDPPKVLRADEIRYWEENKTQLARGNVQFEDSSKTLKADSLQYIDSEDKALAFGHIVFTDIREQMTIKGRRAEYERRLGYANVEGKPEFSQADSAGEVDLTIMGERMEMFDEGARVKVLRNVKVTRGEVVAYCDSLEYFSNGEKIVLFNEPLVVRDQDLLSGQSIDLLLRNRKIYGIQLTGKAFVISRADTIESEEEPFNFLKGEEIYVALEGEKLDTVVVKGRATSYYHVFEEQEEKGINKIIGDEIYMYFTDEQLKRVQVISDPGTSNGTFYPPEMDADLRKELDEQIARLTRKRTGTFLDGEMEKKAEQP